jgi:predicted dehydrogenase
MLQVTDIIALFTPPFLHAEQCLAVLNAGKHVYCEKPLALSALAGGELVSAANASSTRMLIAHPLRYHTLYVTVAAICRDKVLGDLRHIDVNSQMPASDLPPDHWFWDVDKSGGIWVDHGIPFLDAIAWITGAPGGIVGTSAYARAGQIINRVEALAVYGGTGAHFYHSFDEDTPTEHTAVRFTFTGGYITLRESLPIMLELTTWHDSAPLLAYLPGSVTPEKRDERTRRLRAYAPQGKVILHRECVQNAMRDLVMGVRDPSHTLRITPDDALTSLHLALAASQN